MRKLLQKIIQILDGTPAQYGKRERGQSVLEMAFITPLLIVLILGTVEVGWFTNNYLILMEVTRVGARRATILESDDSPIGWERDTMKYNATPDTSGTRQYVQSCSGPFVAATAANPDPFGFYNLIACVMAQSMSPLVLDDTNGEDDIIISAFSIQTFFPAVAPAPALPASVPTNRAVVVARYPSNANECVTFAGERDPFDYFSIGTWNVGAPNQRTELDGYDEPTARPGNVPPIPGDPERQVGYVFFGNHEIPSTTCIGSEFTVANIESLFNLSNMGLNNSTRAYMPSYGVTLVEIYWQHKLLLQFPAFSPFFRMLGNQTTLHVWAAFPTPSIEPRIRFD
jgi:hypothetical protein